MQQFFNTLKRKVKIAEVLKERGFVPSRSYYNKLIYKCPLHKGDNSPSFYVYQKEDGDDFFCYGCKSGGNVIQLVKSLNNCSVKEAIKSVSDLAGLDIDPYYFNFDLDINIDSPVQIDDDIDLILKDITLQYRFNRKNGVIKKNEEIDKLWRSIDESYWSSNFNKLKEIYRWNLGK